MFLGGIMESVCSSVCRCVCVSICVQNTCFCQSASAGIKSRLVTALVYSTVCIYFFLSARSNAMKLYTMPDQSELSAL